MAQDGGTVVKVLTSIDGIEAAAWDACAVPDAATHNPCVSHAFLAALEAAGTVGGRTGWLPQHLVLEEHGLVAAVAPAYLKSNSFGEYVFDHGWAEAYERAGGRYYPKLLIGVPFSPVPGPRLLVRGDLDAETYRQVLAAAAVEVARRGKLSSVHVNFVTEPEWRTLGQAGYLQRTGKQFHWHNAGYDSFEAFLATFASRKRKGVRKERAEALSQGITIDWLQGDAITAADWDAFYAFYTDTGNRKWGRPYLNRKFFSILGATMGERCLIVMARRNGRAIAGALNLIGGDCLYGRYWGALEHHPCLHFEVCYYQAIDFAIAHGLARVEAGAQGSHKLARGYLPVPTYSAHWIGDGGFRTAVERFLAEERAAVAAEREVLTEAGPYRRGMAEVEGAEDS